MSSNLRKHEFMYIAVKSCGCIVGYAMDIPGQETATANSVHYFIRSGYAVDRIPVTYRVNVVDRCEHGDEVNP